MKFHYFCPPLEKSTIAPPWKKSFRRPCLRHCACAVQSRLVTATSPLRITNVQFVAKRPHQAHARHLAADLAAVESQDLCVCWSAIKGKLVFYFLHNRQNLSTLYLARAETVVFNLGGHEPLLVGSPVDVLCTQLYYICFIRVLDGGRWVTVGC